MQKYLIFCLLCLSWVSARKTWAERRNQIFLRNKLENKREKYRNLREQNLPKSLKKVGAMMKKCWNFPKSAKSRPIPVPWANSTHWAGLRLNQQRERRQKYYARISTQNQQENEHQKKTDEEIDEKFRFEEKFSRLMIERGKKIAFHFAEEYRKMKTNQKLSEKEWKWNQPPARLKSSQDSVSNSIFNTILGLYF